jgi:hypothetical protein
MIETKYGTFIYIPDNFPNPDAHETWDRNSILECGKLAVFSYLDAINDYFKLKFKDEVWDEFQKELYPTTLDLIEMLEDMETDPIYDADKDPSMCNPYALNRKLGLIARIFKEIIKDE